MSREITLYMPNGTPVLVRPGILRRLHVRVTPFATPHEMANCRPRPKNYKHFPRRRP